MNGYMQAELMAKRGGMYLYAKFSIYVKRERYMVHQNSVTHGSYLRTPQAYPHREAETWTQTEKSNEWRSRNERIESKRIQAF